jgi:hydroxylamine reductase
VLKTGKSRKVQPKKILTIPIPSYQNPIRRHKKVFCNQCEQTAQGVGCNIRGVCGKSPDVATLIDLLIHSLKGLSLYGVEARKHGVIDDEVNRFTIEAAFATLTNVNFDPLRFVELIRRSIEMRDVLKAKVKAAGGRINFTEDAVTWTPALTLDAMVKQGESVGLKADVSDDPDIQSLHQIILFGVKGVSAYADHALLLGQKDDSVFAFIHKALGATLNPDLTIDELVGLVLECGKINLRVMELLDAANTGIYGHPVPTTVPLGVKKGKAILVSGHDLKDLEEILKQTDGKGIYVYTHGEMLPTHGYPRLKQYSHFYGHFGTAWQNQRKEFETFPGAILMTTNCIRQPVDSYKNNIFTTGLVGNPDVRHLPTSDFTLVIEKALKMPGFPEDQSGKFVTVGFGHNAVLNVAGDIVKAVKNKAIRHFFLVAGCDGAKAGRNYYTEFVEKVPADCVVLTLACGKFRFFNKDLGKIGGIPRLLDVGQCNDAYSAIQIALTLTKAFDVGINELPLSIVLSWYEQKAVAILLTLLYLGVKNIRLGPSLPAFITPNILKTLVDSFNIMSINTPDEDLKAILG